LSNITWGQPNATATEVSAGCATGLSQDWLQPN